MTSQLILPSFSRGFAICTPRGAILEHSYRQTVAEAIAAAFGSQPWPPLLDDGYTVQFVYARIWVPQFFPKSKEKTDEQS